jgi:uncharacterized protein (TIGR02246 family)
MTTTEELTKEAAAERDRIALMPERLVAAWEAQDADAFADLFTDDGTLVLPGVYKQGRDEIREFMAAAFASDYKGTTVTGQPIAMRPLASGAIALLTVGAVLRPPDFELSERNAVRASWILVKQNTDWKLAVYHNCPRDTTMS